MTPPVVSVVMATYNGAAKLPETIDSLLSQTLTAFELIVVDDCSTDSTRELLRGYADERLKILSTPVNSGPVRARNLAVKAARGQYVAALDQDDISLPHRLERQVAYLDAHPQVAVLGTAARRLVNGRLIQDRLGAHTTPGFIRWMLHVMNPLVWSSVMLRMTAVEKLDVFSRQERLFAEDFDLYHRLAAYGEIARLDEVLTTYRWHAQGASSTCAAQMVASAGAVLEDAYRPWFGNGAVRAAELVNRHIAARQATPNTATFLELRHILSALFEAFARTYGPDQKTRALIAAQTTRILRDAVGDGIKGKFRTAKFQQRTAACV